MCTIIFTNLARHVKIKRRLQLCILILHVEKDLCLIGKLVVAYKTR